MEKESKTSSPKDSSRDSLLSIITVAINFWGSIFLVERWGMRDVDAGLAAFGAMFFFSIALWKALKYQKYKKYSLFVLAIFHVIAPWLENFLGGSFDRIIIILILNIITTSVYAFMYNKLKQTC